MPARIQPKPHPLQYLYSRFPHLARSRNMPFRRRRSDHQASCLTPRCPSIVTKISHEAEKMVETVENLHQHHQIKSNNLQKRPLQE
ncbi:hypothetical protein TNCV_3822501 [Trichonephila clavipes]|nr:hypothetical protein TNCV_3822501 [Trichonephila clavipes]